MTIPKRLAALDSCRPFATGLKEAVPPLRGSRRPCRAGAVLGQAFGRRRKTKPRLATPVPSKPSNYRFATSSSPHPQPRSHRPTCAILGRRTNEILTVVDIVADLPVPGSQVHLRQLARRCRFRTGRRELIELATTFEYRADRVDPAGASGYDRRHARVGAVDYCRPFGAVGSETLAPLASPSRCGSPRRPEEFGRQRPGRRSGD
jgi:hypothetical protein